MLIYWRVSIAEVMKSALLAKVFKLLAAREIMGQDWCSTCALREMNRHDQQKTDFQV